MLSNFNKIVADRIGDRSKEVEEKVYKYQNILNEIEKDLDYGKIDAEEAMKRLRSRFSYHLTNDDYRRIEKELRYNVK